jgi:serine/threonine-protein kinase
MGVVLRALDENLRREVAIKVLRPEALGDSGSRKRLLREARMAATLKHPNITMVHAVGEEPDGTAYVVMELVAGGTLRDRLNGAPRGLAVADALRLARAIASALAHAHAAGVVHRDLKPENVALDPEVGPKLLDFGLAKLSEARASDANDASTSTGGAVTQEGHVTGTPAYMSPEQIRGLPIGPESDVYSFGVMLFELLTGQRPFRGVGVAELAAAVLRDAPAPPSALTPAVPAEVDRLVARCMSKDARDRPASGRALVEALDDVLAAPASGRAGAATGGLETVREVVERPEPSPPSRRRSLGPRELALAGPDRNVPVSRRAWWPIALGASLGATVAGASALWLTGRSSPIGTGVSVSRASPVRLVDLPAPAECSSEAAREVREGLSILRAVGWDAAAKRFSAALRADPGCATAHLRLMMVTRWWTARADPRAEFREAMRRRDRLSERDRGLLDALEATMARDPPDATTEAARFEALVLAAPNDAEILQLASARAKDPERALHLAQRAVEVDPGYVDALQALVRAELMRENIPGAERALDQCARLAPAAVDCTLDRLHLANQLGDCRDQERVARDLRAKDLEDPLAASFLASSLAAQSASPALVREAIQQELLLLTPSTAFRAHIHLAGMLLLQGDFEAADAKLTEIERDVSARPDLEAHFDVSVLRLELLVETGRVRVAAALAKELLEKTRVWLASTKPSSFHAWFFEPELLSVVRRSGGPLPDATARLERWRARASNESVQPRAVWAYGTAMQAETADEARAARASMPAWGSVPEERALVEALAGRVLHRAGAPREAVPRLRAATMRCDALVFPFHHTRAHAWLGAALEGTGDVPGACAAYDVVRSRWGGAKPGSLTAQETAVRRRALGCDRGEP